MDSTPSCSSAASALTILCWSSNFFTSCGSSANRVGAPMLSGSAAVATCVRRIQGSVFAGREQERFEAKTPKPFALRRTPESLVSQEG